MVTGACLGHAAQVRDLVADILGGARAPRALQAEAAAGATEALTAISEAAHACWIRLLNARCAAAAHSGTLPAGLVAVPTHGG